MLWEIRPIVCQMVAYGGLKTNESSKQASLKVVACKRCPVSRGFIWSDLTWKLLVIWKGSY